MHIKKLIPLLLILPLSGCLEQDFVPDQLLIKDIWQVVIKITKIPKNTPLPEIDFSCSYDPAKDGKLGRYDFVTKRIEVYPMQIYSFLWKWREGHPYESIDYNQSEAFLYSVVAHEMFHYALHIRNETISQHQLIRDRQYMQQILDFINDCSGLSRDGIQNEIALQCLKAGIETDAERIKSKK